MKHKAKIYLTLKVMDLFGEQTPVNDARAPRDTILKSFTRRANLRQAPPGNIRCLYCENVRRNGGASRIYYKCVLIGTSHGASTDIKAGQVCNFFKTIKK